MALRDDPLPRDDRGRGCAAVGAGVGATWTTQTTSGPTALAKSALTSVSCVSALSCILENRRSST